MKGQLALIGVIALVIAVLFIVGAASLQSISASISGGLGGGTTEMAEIPCASVEECTSDFPIPAVDIECQIIDGVSRCFTMQTITR